MDSDCVEGGSWNCVASLFPFLHQGGVQVNRWNAPTPDHKLSGVSIRADALDFIPYWGCGFGYYVFAPRIARLPGRAVLWGYAAMVRGRTFFGLLWLPIA